MPSIFTRILAGEIPGRIVWEDASCFALLTAAPIRPGHLLVVPREEIDHWIDLPPHLGAHLFEVARVLGQALQRGFRPAKVGVAIIGLEVRHVHLHLVPMQGPEDLDFARQNKNPDPAMMDAAAGTIRRELRAMGRKEAAG